MSKQAIVSFAVETIPIPFSGYIRLFLYTFVIWFFAWQVLNFLDTRSTPTLLLKSHLRNGMLYSIRPLLSNNLAVWLAGIVLVIAALNLILVLAVTIPKLITFWQSLPNISLTQVAALVSRDAFPSLVIHPRTIVLAVFTLIVNQAFRIEKQRKYRLDMKRNQIRRKRESREIIVPSFSD